MQLYACLSNSLSKEGKNKISVCRPEYEIGGVTSGVAFLKVIIRESYIDTNATTAHIRTQLSSLDTYLPTVGHDIGKMNIHVKNLIGALTARGESSTDILSNLFKGYKASTDKVFVRYIEKKEEDYEEGAAIGADTLMQMASTKFKILVQAGRWNAPSAEEEKILALETKILELSKGKAKAKGGPKKDQKESKAKYKYDPNNKPAWMTTPPGEGEPTSKMMHGKEYHWCPKHEAWGRHVPEKCEGKGYRPPRKDETPEPPSQAKTSRTAKLAKAFKAIIDDDDSDDCDDCDIRDDDEDIGDDDDDDDDGVDT